MTKTKSGVELSYQNDDHNPDLSEVTLHFNSIQANVLRERIRQGVLHPGRTPRHVRDKYFALAIATEEFGEIAKAMMDETPQHVYDETVQTIACLVAMLEGMIERGELP